MRNKSLPIIPLSLCICALAACAPAAPSRVETSVPAVSTAPAVPASSTLPAATAVSAQATAAATTAPSASPTKAAASVPFPSSEGLRKLDSYDMTARVSYRGTRDGQPVNTTDYYTRSFSLDPSAQFTTVQTSDEDGRPTILIRGLVGDVAYTRARSDEPCIARTATANSPSVFNPVALIKPFFQGKDMGQEMVNGLTTHHYTMEPRRNADTEMSGDVWLADKNTYAVKYTVVIKAGEAYFGKGSKGEQTIAYELNNVGAKKPIAIPNGCLPRVTDLPAMQDAANVKRSLLELSYTTAFGAEKVAAFYQEQMKSLGWTLESMPTVPPTPPANRPSVPGLPQLPQVPGVDLGQLLSSALPTAPVPTLKNSWLVFMLAEEHRYVYVTIQREGAGSRVIAEIVQQ